MKNIVKVLLIALFISSPAISKAQRKIDTTNFQVAGVCDMCKERIEKAALLRGVKYTEWEKSSEQLMVIYRADKVKLEEVHKSLAKMGHDTEKIKATEEAYAKLPDCCAYRSGIEKH